MKQPQSQLQEVLYFLLTRKTISCRQMMFDTYILNLSARLSDLKLDHGIEIKMTKTHRTNKFDRKISYGTWGLVDREHALEVYKKLTDE